MHQGMLRQHIQCAADQLAQRSQAFGTRESLRVGQDQMGEFVRDELGLACGELAEHDYIRPPLDRVPCWDPVGPQNPVRIGRMEFCTPTTSGPRDILPPHGIIPMDLASVAGNLSSTLGGISGGVGSGGNSDGAAANGES